MKRFHRGCFGILLIRVIIGVVFLHHGLTKLLDPTTGMIDFVGGAAFNIGLTFLSVQTWFWIAAIAETVGGVLLILGLATRFAASILGVIMIFAISMKGSTFVTSEFEYTLLGVLIALLFTGPKKYSLDAVMHGGEEHTNELH